MSTAAPKTIILVSSDGEKYEVPLKSALMSNLVKLASDPEVPKEVPLREVRAGPLAHIAAFLKHYDAEEYKYIEKVREREGGMFWPFRWPPARAAPRSPPRPPTAGAPGRSRWHPGARREGAGVATRGG
jgi:hypothetical protein